MKYSRILGVAAALLVTSAVTSQAATPPAPAAAAPAPAASTAPAASATVAAPAGATVQAAPAPAPAGTPQSPRRRAESAAVNARPSLNGS